VCKIVRTRVRGGRAADPPGTLITGGAGERFLAVVCGDGTLLEVLELQLPNRKPQTGIDFLNGFRVTAGERLGASR
jgi:methionyl-tRNA formyltransferase